MSPHSNTRSSDHAYPELTMLSFGESTAQERQDAGLLFECAPDSALHTMFGTCFELDRLIGDFESTKSAAAALAHKLLETEPRIRGIGQLRVLEELVIRELQHIIHALNLHQFLREHAIRECRFTARSELAGILARIAEQRGTRLEIVAPEQARRLDRLKRVWQRLRDDRFAVAALRREFGEAMRRADPYHALSRLRRTQQYAAGKIWFYSTARSTTNIGLLYEPHFAQAFEYLVEDPLTGGAPLRETGRAFTNGCSFSAPGMAPSAEEIAEACRKLRAHLMQTPLNGVEDEARHLFMKSDFLNTFFNNYLPMGMYKSRLFARWIEDVRPAALVVGNPVFEGYALLAAKDRGIPTILLQHGILGDYCQFVDPPVDHYIVRGAFWRDFLSPPARAKAVIANPEIGQRARVSDRREEQGKHILFLTAAYHVHAYFNEFDLDEILKALLNAAAEARRNLMIRVHPLDSLGLFQAKISALTENIKDAPYVTYSQGSGLHEVVVGASVAVTYCSTVFLDCLRCQVPIVSFGWHDFPFKRKISEYGVFHFARDLAHLETLVCDATKGELPAYAGGVESFMDSMSSGELMAICRGLVTPAATAPGRH